MPYTFIEVCAGAGGLSTALINIGFIPLLLNDNNKDCCKTLEKNHPNIPIKCCPMESLDLTEYINKCDLLAGGIPCQSWSFAGQRKGFDDERGNLMLKYIDLILTVKPKIFLIENVKGLLTHNSGISLQFIIDTINTKCGNTYNIKYKLLNAVHYGVPQKRERVFIIGILKQFSILNLSHLKLNINYEFPVGNSNIKVLKDVLNNVPYSQGSKYSVDKIKLFKYIPQGGCWINLPEGLQKSYLGKSYFSGGGKRGILHRLSLEKPSLTLLCSPAQKQTERCHPIEDRPLTIREYARIQTFDDTYEFIGSISSQYRQIGNAIPVELAKFVGISLIEVLNKMNNK